MGQYDALPVVIFLVKQWDNLHWHIDATSTSIGGCSIENLYPMVTLQSCCLASQLLHKCLTGTR